MEPLIKSDIFFFISSIATVLLTVLVSVLLYYLIIAARNLQKLSEVLKQSGEFVEDLKDRLDRNLIFRLFFPSTKRKLRNKEE